MVDQNISAIEFKEEYLKCIVLSVYSQSPDFPFRGLLKLPQDVLDKVTDLLEQNPPEAGEEG